MLYLIFHILLAEFIVFYISNMEAPANAKLFSYHPENYIFLLVGNIILVFLSILFTIYVPDYIGSFFVRISIALSLYAVVDLGVQFLSSSETTGRISSFIIKLLAFIGALVFVFFVIDDIQFTTEEGFLVEVSPFTDTLPLLNGATLAIGVFVYFIPLVCVIVSILHSAVIHRRAKVRQMFSCFATLLIIWLSVPFIYFVLNEQFPFASIILFLMGIGIATMIARRVVRSDARKSNFSFFLLNASQYILPAAIMGSAYSLLINICEDKPALFMFLICVVAVLDLYFTHAYGEFIINFRRNHNRKVVSKFEKELRLIDFNSERVEVATDYAKALQKYIRSSAMLVYTNNGSENLATVFDSRNPESNSVELLPFTKNMETFLLKTKKILFRKSDLDSEIDSTSNKKLFAELFAKTNSAGCIVIISKNHVSSLIFLGRKTDGSDYTKYDIESVSKLYSYFFIFTYYLLNVASRKSASVIESDNQAVQELTQTISKHTEPKASDKYDSGTFLKKATISSGDFFDSIELSGNKHLFILGKISGMGLATTVSSMLLKETIHSLLPSTPDFKQLVIKINKYIYNFMPKGTIFSGMFAIADFAADNFYYINCGIQTISVLASDLNKIYEVQGDGRVLGFVEDISNLITVQKRHLKKDDIIFSYTEGIIESSNITSYYKNKQRFQDLVFANTQYNSERMAKFIYDDFIRTEDITGDVSILILKRRA